MTAEPLTDGRRKLTDDQIREIRYLIGRPCPTCDALPSLASLGRKFGVSTPAVHQIVTRHIHRDVPDRRAARTSGTTDVHRLDEAAEFLRTNGILFDGPVTLRFAAEILAAADHNCGVSTNADETG